MIAVCFGLLSRRPRFRAGLHPLSGLCWSFENECFFVSERVGRVSESGADIFCGQARIAIEEISLGGTFVSFLRINSTGMRVPRMTGFPIMTLGLISIRSWHACAADFKSLWRAFVPSSSQLKRGLYSGYEDSRLGADAGISESR
jgi:hypothetical protein